MVTRRIEAAQKKVEERNFDQRKNLLEYDEVMDTQRKRIYGARQAILNNRNCKLLVLEYIDEQINKQVDELLSPAYGQATFATFVQGRLLADYEANDFRGCDFQQAEQYAKEKAQRMLETTIQDGLDENLSEEEDPNEWKWNAMANKVNTAYGLKLTDRDLKKVGRENLNSYLYEECSNAINAVDLEEGRQYLEGDWGRKSLQTWAQQKFAITLTDGDVQEASPEAVKKLLRKRVREVYREREVKFPVDVAMNQFMAEKSAHGAQHYDRQGLLVWCGQRFPTMLADVPEEEFRTEPRSKLRNYVLAASQKTLPVFDFDVIDKKIVDELAGTRLSEAADAAELAKWIKEEVKLDIAETELTGVTVDQARQAVWNAFDRRYRPEMRGMERSLLLSQLDSAWKQHLLIMDRLRATVGLRSYAQVDPKTEYKREGMAEFDRMFVNMKERITELVFRMEEEGDIQQSVWSIASTTHESAASLSTQAAAVKPIEAPEQQRTNSNEPEKKVETIRNTEKRVGRNEPCPCGSGKKYKNCHMRQDGAKR
jgi:preprotein translocase subunit SecA